MGGGSGLEKVQGPSSGRPVPACAASGLRRRNFRRGICRILPGRQKLPSQKNRKKTSSAETPAPAPAEESPAPTAAEPAETTPIPPPESLPAGEAAEPSEVPEESPAGKWIGWLPLTRAIRAVEIPSRSRWARGLRRRRQKSVPERMGRHQA